MIGAEPLDLARKIERARSLNGPRLILALAPCPTGWDYDPRPPSRSAGSPCKTGIWPLKEYVDGKVTHSKSRIPGWRCGNTSRPRAASAICSPPGKTGNDRGDPGRSGPLLAASGARTEATTGKIMSENASYCAPMAPRPCWDRRSRPTWPKSRPAFRGGRRWSPSPRDGGLPMGSLRPPLPSWPAGSGPRLWQGGPDRHLVHQQHRVAADPACHRADRRRAGEHQPRLPQRELAYALQRSEVQGLFLIPSFKTSDYVAMLIELMPELAHCSPDTLASKEFPFLRRVVLYNPADPLHTERLAPGLHAVE